MSTGIDSVKSQKYLLSEFRAVILAAGLSTRMKSTTQKMFHPLGGIPLIQHITRQVSALISEPPVLVISPLTKNIFNALASPSHYVLQKHPSGTGDALLATRALLEGKSEHLLVAYGDIPLVTEVSLKRLVAHHTKTGAEITFLTANDGPRSGMGRVIRNPDGQVKSIIEERQASQEQLALTEVNGGIYCFRTRRLWSLLEKLPTASNRESQLTDLVTLMLQAGGKVEALPVHNGWELLGINTRYDLAQAEWILRDRARQILLSSGVTLADPSSIFIDTDVKVSRDTVIMPNTHLQGSTHIGQACTIGPNTIIANSKIGNRCRVVSSMVEESTLESGVMVGPFSHLRPGTYLERGVQIGNFVEVKESRLGRDTKVSHHSYLGDATIGRAVNIGAGVITCNYDGKNKHRTTIEGGAFIGAGTKLIAPVTVGRSAITGAGAVIIHNVKPKTLVVGVPARPKPRTLPNKIKIKS
jgi:bifunctional UDP-N-acetylglucosamine pyrophosphorylase/glucosamine-1-phosphate N-acetyltransferase